MVKTMGERYNNLYSVLILDVLPPRFLVHSLIHLKVYIMVSYWILST